MLFEDDLDALRYLQDKVPAHPPTQEELPDMADFERALFDIPDNPTEGHHEFEGPNGYKVSFNLQTADYKHDDCWEIYRPRLSNGDLTGNINPIFLIKDLTIETPNGRHNLNDYDPRTEVIWLPGLKSMPENLSYAYLRIEARKMYLPGKVGFFSRVRDLCTYFHELGHMETRSPADMAAEKRTTNITYSRDGAKGDFNKEVAYELQRERDADAWMALNLGGMLRDLGVSRRQLMNYITKVQLESYNANGRSWITHMLAKLEETAPLSPEEAEALLLEGAEAFNARRVDLPKWEIKLTDGEVSGLQCAGINLKKAELPGKKFSSCILISADLEGADLTGCSFIECELGDATFEDATVKDCTISNSNLAGVSFNGARTLGGKLDVIDSNLQGVDLENAQILYGEFRNVQFQNAKLWNTVLACSLSGVNMDGALGRRVDFDSSVTILDCSFVGADLLEANFWGCKFQGCNFTDAKLVGVNMCNAILTGSDFTNADLSGAKLNGADFRGAKLTGVKLEGADTEGALGLEGVLKK